MITFEIKIFHNTNFNIFKLKEIQSILKSISEGKIHNNYFLMGNQPYFINLIVKLEEKLVGKNNRELI